MVLVLLLVEQPFGVGVIVFGLLVGGVEAKRLLVAFERFPVLLLFEPGVPEVIERLGPLVVGAERVGCGRGERLRRLVIGLGAVERPAQIVCRLEVARRRFECLFVAADALEVLAFVELPVALAHQSSFGVVLGPGGCAAKQREGYANRSKHGRRC